MSSKTPYAAYRKYIDAVLKIIQCLPRAYIRIIKPEKISSGASIEWELIDTKNMESPGLFIKKIGRIKLEQTGKIIVANNGNRALYAVAIASYLYEIDFVSGESLAWHLHPEGFSPVKVSHMHLPPNPKVHIYCKRASLQDVIRVFIDYLLINGEKLPCQNWEEIFAESSAKYEL